MKYFVLFLALVQLSSCAQEGATTAQEPATEHPAAIRGVWLTNVASEVLDSRQNIAEAMDLLVETGFNTVFVVTWNRAHTQYPSAVMEQLTGVAIDPRFAGRDPLQEVIDEAHSRDLKVFAWFEFGFSCSYGDSTGGPLVAVKPEWAARDQQGNVATKNNFQWLNALHPEVQSFMISLVTEVVGKYDVDGIQGDDRLPAMPTVAGYSDYTKQLYAQEHGGTLPPTYEKDFEWVVWRGQKLNAFMKDLYTAVKAQDSTCLVSSSPSIYPWSLENYLQDWPTWLSQGYVDVVVPQCYRYDAKAYEALLKDITQWQVAPDQLDRVYPGVLLQVDTYNPEPEFLAEMIRLNRAYGFPGEVHFFYEGIKQRQETFDSLYHEAVSFPEWPATVQPK